MGDYEARSFQPMLIGNTADPFDSDEYWFEIKFDGSRCLAYAEKGRTELRNKRHENLTERFPELQQLASLVKVKCVLDGELFIMRNGIPDFSALQKRALLKNPFKIKLAMEKYPASFVAYDILYYKDRDVTSQPLKERRKLLEKSFKESGSISLSRIVERQGIAFFELACQQNLEGIVAKRKESSYLEGKRTKDWIKIKNMQEEDFAVLGYLQKESDVVSLVLAQKGPDGWVYCGHVTYGVKMKLIQNYNPNLSKKCLFKTQPNHHEKAVWFDPGLVCTVRYMLKTENGQLRQPILKGFRTDKRADECLLAQ